MKNTQEGYHSSIIDRHCRNIRLKSIMVVDHWFDWIDKYVQPDRGHTEEENIAAWDYANKQTNAYFASISHATKLGDVVTIHFKNGTVKTSNLIELNRDYPDVELR